MGAYRGVEALFIVAAIGCVGTELSVGEGEDTDEGYEAKGCELHSGRRV